jgi:hypothetical protein
VVLAVLVVTSGVQVGDNPSPLQRGSRMNDILKYGRMIRSLEDLFEALGTTSVPDILSLSMKNSNS